jgi:hypothetical protein
VGSTITLFNQEEIQKSTTTKATESTVYIWNMSEDVWPFISSIGSEEGRRYEIDENANLGDRELFSFAGEEHILFISPYPISESFLRYYQEVTGNRDIRVLVPEHHTGVICEDILHDPDLLSEIIKVGKSVKRLMVVSYATTMPFLQLVQELVKNDLPVFTPEAPEWEDAWTVNFFGSKSGIRQLAQKSRIEEPDFHMTDGVICMGITDAAKIAARRYIENNSVVIKTNKGHSGAGVLLLRPGELPTQYTQCENAIYEMLTADAYWEKFPIIIEDFIQVNPSVAGGCPSIEFRIYKSGRIDSLYYCGMRVNEQGVFQGVEIADDVVPARMAATMVDTGFFIAEQYAAAGYRGYFDVDYVVAKNGDIFVTESNVRRTGGTFVYHVAEELIGKDFMYQCYILSNNLWKLPQGVHYEFSELITTAESVLFNKKTKEGVIFISANVLRQNRVGYIVIAKNKKRALEIEETMQQLLTAS